MTQSAATPTFIDTILEACRQVQNGRGHRDIALHALTELGELAQEVQVATGRAPGKVAGEDGIAGEALDLILCVVDFLHCLNDWTSDWSIMAAVNSSEAGKGVSYASFALHSWSGQKPIKPADLADHLLSMGNDLGQICGLDSALWDDGSYDATIPAARIIHDCLHLISTEIPGIDEEGLIAMARPKLGKWIARTLTSKELA